MGNLSECALNRKLRDIGHAGSRKVILRKLQVQKAKVPKVASVSWFARNTSAENISRTASNKDYLDVLDLLENSVSSPKALAMAKNIQGG